MLVLVCDIEYLPQKIPWPVVRVRPRPSRCVIYDKQERRTQLPYSCCETCIHERTLRILIKLRKVLAVYLVRGHPKVDLELAQLLEAFHAGAA